MHELQQILKMNKIQLNSFKREGKKIKLMINVDMKNENILAKYVITWEQQRPTEQV